MAVDLRRTLPRHVTAMVGIYWLWLSIQNALLTRLGRDSHAYWVALNGDHLYGTAPGTADAYNYSPAFAQVLWPLAQLPWPVFGVTISVLATISFLHLLRPLGWGWALPLTLFAAPEIIAGNIFWLLALVAAYGLRPTRAWPALWVVPLLTKLTPTMGPLWFLVRREWRPLLVALLATSVVVAVSFALEPQAWREWLDFLRANQGGNSERTGTPLAPPLVYRLPVALALLVWCALTDRRWGLPVAMILATPVTGLAALTVLAALPRLYLDDEEERSTTQTAPATLA